MTSERLNEILDEQKIVRYRQHFLKAMKQAVNEALDEAADLEATGVSLNKDIRHATYCATIGYWNSFRNYLRSIGYRIVKRKDLLNLKVK